MKATEATPLSPAPPDELAQALRAIGDRRRLEILRLLDSGELGVKEVAGAIGISPPQARAHLKSLTACGLIESYPTASGPRFHLNRRAATLLNASLVSLLGRVGSTAPPADPPAHFGDGEVLSLVAPPAPQACLQCQNSTFVRGILEDLDYVLADARRYQTRLQLLSSQVLAAHEGERKRIARELHDDTAQALTSILVRLRLLERSVEDREIHQTVQELRELTANTLDSVRRMAVDLRPTALDDLGLVAALRSYVEKFSRTWPIDVEFSSEGLRRRLPAEVELVLYRVVQEALSNVAKHSGARSASVALSRKRNTVTATVRDDGRGFSLEKALNSGRSGLGLFGMQERLTLVGGRIEIHSVPGEGTAVVARAPLAQTAHRHN